MLDRELIGEYLKDITEIHVIKFYINLIAEFLSLRAKTVYIKFYIRM